jgi:hypothetical protein
MRWLRRAWRVLIGRPLRAWRKPAITYTCPRFEGGEQVLWHDGLYVVTRISIRCATGIALYEAIDQHGRIASITSWESERLA